ncbi:LpqB family beta-propeller domain-containing protein [Nocardioides sp. Root140]|uniref:LpqB family beta-propeller domain-containing protein n=1 Tax=Nocardioides sp. Root140 TaxID=1736460 RepID=UPI0007009DCA|nr:LpqB family beta-propeller domain-containing protein [Nocardioides sp. Root140]KQY56265.1 hypothetical protein ASD30_07870 [Nocardioides sp. Root140]
MTPYARALVAVALLVSLCSACVGLPDSGEVQVGDDRPTSAQDSGFPYDPRPPQKGEEPDEIVGHFLDAMLANPTTTAVAKQFLSSSARDSWHPDRQLITYDDILTPSGNDEVSVTLLGAHHLDARGVWRGELPERQRTLDFGMTIEDGEWRIDDPPDAMVVSDAFFDARYRQVFLYFLDPTAKVVVPEPVFVPTGGQLSAVLMRALLRGPGPDLRGVTRSYIPDDLTLDLTAPVSANGLAEVSLRGDAAPLDPESVQLMAVQVVWTLRQDPSVRRVRLTINDTPISVSGTSSDLDVAMGEQYNPVGPGAGRDLFALRDGRLVSQTGSGVVNQTGPFGTEAAGLEAIAVDLSGTRVAGVTSDGGSIRLAPVSGERERATTVFSGGTDLLKPSWDVSGRLWVVDRNSGNAEVSYVTRGRRHPVRVPGVTGENITRAIVSRDGTRLVAVLREPRQDRVVLSRLAVDGSRARGTRARVIHGDAEERTRINDIGWYSPTEVVLVRSLSDDLSQVTTFSVDGSRAVSSANVPVELVRDDIVSLVSSPVPETPTWAIAASGEVHELNAELDGTFPAEGLVSLTYAG